MRKRIRSLRISVLFLIISFIFSANIQVNAEENNKNRIYGRDRYETSAKVSKEGWSKGSETVIIVNGQKFADGICAAPLAKKHSAPILLTNDKSLPKSVDEEIKRLKPKKIFILGGEGVVSKNIENNLNNGNLKVERVGGRNRYETSLLIAKQLGKVDEIAVSSGKGFADSLSISSIAANKGMPILLVDGNEISKDAIKYVKENEVKKSYVLGSSKIVSSKIESKLPNVKRLWGKNRYETNLEILKEFKDEIKFNKVYVTLSHGNETGVDALSVAPLAAKEGHPIVLIDNNNINKSLRNFVSSKLDKDSEVIALGSDKIVPDSIVKSIKENNDNVDNEDKEDSEDKDEDKNKDKDEQDNDDSKSDKFVLVVSENGNTVLKKNVEVCENKSAADYLKENTTVVMRDGFITTINGKKNVEFKELTEEERKRGIMGVDWFIYLNGPKTTVGAEGVYPKKGDVLTFDYHPWNWTEFASMDQTMPLIIKSPFSVPVGTRFKVTIICYGYPVYNAKVTFDNKDYYTDINGEVWLVSNSPGKHRIFVDKEGATKSKGVTIKPISTDPSDPKENKDEILTECNYQQGQLKIIKDKEEYVNIYFKSNSIKEDRVTITLYDDSGNLKYIGQGKLKDGELIFKTKLDKGKYNGYFRFESIKDKIKIKEFTR